MSKLPYSRVVNVTLSRVNNFPSIRGFGVALLLTNVAVAGKIDATTRTKVYGSMDEIVADHAANTPVYAAAEDAFSQNPRPLQIKVGYIAFTAPGTKADLKAQLDLVYDFDQDFYWVGHVAALRDLAALDGLIEWVQTKNKVAVIDSNDVLMQSVADTTNVAARNKDKGFDRSFVFYHTDPSTYGAFAYAASLGTRNFDNADTAYTGKFKKLIGIAPVNVGSAAIQAITGFTPQLGQSLTAGHMANTVVDIGGQVFALEGSMLVPNVFIDAIHASDWIVARTEEATLGVMLNNERIPFTDAGMELLASGARQVMRIADAAGLIANDLDPETGDYSPSVIFSIPSALSVPASQRNARIAPAITVTFRYAGAVHYTTINYRMTF